jgi:sodium-coupled neutral amino acid transporter 11
MALAGFLTFGDKTQGNVLNNFPRDNTMVNVARLCFGLNMLTTLPLEAFVCREVMLNYYFPGEPFNMNLHLLLSTSLVFSAMVLSLVTCDLGTVFDLVGGTSAAAMAYILPPLCYIKLTTRSWKTYVAWAVVAFGCTVMAMSMLQAVGKMIRGELPRRCGHTVLVFWLTVLAMQGREIPGSATNTHRLSAIPFNRRRICMTLVLGRSGEYRLIEEGAGV